MTGPNSLAKEESAVHRLLACCLGPERICSSNILHLDSAENNFNKRCQNIFCISLT